MKKMLGYLGAAALAATGTTAVAAPDKPINAARTMSGTGCGVRASADDPSFIDTTCEWKQVVKRDSDGTLTSLHYQDKGMLQEGQTAPDRAVRFTTDGYSVAGLDCAVAEVVTPSGTYASSLICN